MRRGWALSVLIALLAAHAAQCVTLDQILKEESSKVDGVKCPNKVAKKDNPTEVAKGSLALLRKGDGDKVLSSSVCRHAMPCTDRMYGARLRLA